MQPDAVIFDLDGVITDTAHLHFVAWRQVAADIGISIDETFNQQLKGISRMGSLERILTFGGKDGQFSAAEKAALAARKNACYVDSLRSLTPQAVLPGIAELLPALREAGIGIGLASVSLNAPAILRALGLADAFDFCADAARLTRSKPDPEIFLAACAGLGVRPERCIGVEDAQAGIDAINACGMIAVGIGASLNGAQLRLDDTAQLTWPRLHALWNQQRRATARCQ
ncbi:beta-phosphoglucomutase [Cronobacter muytjensii]|uniref:beta-phosphoglucomutase n=1 Tax=Cronobacter muytjensii TaxID=413501 RepID=UPI001375E0DA|nr:beta-phosphoglucomutase [Cronobacter muytjensii]EKS1845214.1 beta-phosphoglucomutase [Cronobacter muytjensii]ELY2496435.1 beta-phosphoglucomutase [Cronobacter muytjensii]ELY4520335.1 beta-phosphoglucomutase [Cronobacter muytjensii]ELY6224729.1 beta-phosphoglucomutase [Cronobacter muytjensii]ELY6273988.1 beta-phosphoglucomutase [Cronobacter muytjensii]